MNLSLSDTDSEILRALLSDYLHELRLEVARTEAKDFRHTLLLRQDLAERLLAQLDTERGSRTMG